ncbi:unnamed protein product, partial [Iphiclides podalirius]
MNLKLLVDVAYPAQMETAGAPSSERHPRKSLTDPYMRTSDYMHRDLAIGTMIACVLITQRRVTSPAVRPRQVIEYSPPRVLSRSRAMNHASFTCRSVHYHMGRHWNTKTPSSATPATRIVDTLSNRRVRNVQEFVYIVVRQRVGIKRGLAR